MRFEEIRSLVVSAELHLLAYARALTGDDDASFDLLQETCLRALERYAEIRSAESCFGWMRTVMRNLYYEQARQRRALSLDELAVDVPDAFVSHYTSATGPDWVGEMEDEFGYLRRFLGRLQPAVRRFLTAVLEERDRERVCARLGIDPRTFSMYLSRMKTDLIELGATRVMFPEGSRSWYVELPPYHPLHGCYSRVCRTCAHLTGGWYDPERRVEVREQDRPIALATGCLLVLFSTLVHSPPGNHSAHE